MTKNSILPQIEKQIQALKISEIGEERHRVLAPLVTYLHDKIVKNKPIALNFICTHNSRRSHLSQIWAQTLAHYVGIKNLDCYSGGTEATAMFSMVIATLKSQGFEIKPLSDAKNPVYSIKYAVNQHPAIGFSKTFDDPFNPQSNFGAIMTCTSADTGCPIVPGCDARFPITYEDPKAFDNTPQQAEKYLERSIQIATELFYVMQKAVFTLKLGLKFFHYRFHRALRKIGNLNIHEAIYRVVKQGVYIKRYYFGILFNILLN